MARFGGRRGTSTALALGEYGHEGPAALATLYVTALGAPNTINTMPERTLLALADAGMPAGGMFSQTEDPCLTLEEFKLAGIVRMSWADHLQRTPLSASPGTGAKRGAPGPKILRYRTSYPRAVRHALIARSYWLWLLASCPGGTPPPTWVGSKPVCAFAQLWQS
jgi:hypothetical protein